MVLYPNPTTGIFTLSIVSPESKSELIEIYGLPGRKVKSFQRIEEDSDTKKLNLLLGYRNCLRYVYLQIRESDKMKQFKLMKNDLS